MAATKRQSITRLIGAIPHRLALAGGWIDQPFVSRHNPRPPGSMVVVSLHPEFHFMDRSGICSSTRNVAMRIWKGKLPKRNPAELVRELYHAENEGKKAPSGSQDMIGLVYPGVSRLDYDFGVHGGVFPAHIESNNNPGVARWLEKVLQLLPIEARPPGYNPLGRKNLEPKWVARLGQSGKDCFEAIAKKDAKTLGATLTENMTCWEKLLPDTLHHRSLRRDLFPLLRHYQTNYHGAMYSGCGGGYIMVVSDEPVPGAFRVRVRTEGK